MISSTKPKNKWTCPNIQSKKIQIAVQYFIHSGGEDGSEKPPGNSNLTGPSELQSSTPTILVQVRLGMKTVNMDITKVKVTSISTPTSTC